MPRGRRVLVLGVTGIDKISALQQLERHRTFEADVTNLHIVDFEDEYLSGGSGNFTGYLLRSEADQRYEWERGWRAFMSTVHQRDESDDILVSLHATFTRPFYSTRTPLLLNALQEFKPTSVITLIDDVYEMWHRTEERARGAPWRGRLTLEQLITARRSEILVGDMIARHMEPPQTNWVVAVRHPARTLHRLIFGPPKVVRPVYLSFPISKPRELLKAGDSSGVDAVNEFLREAAAVERAAQNAAFFCPLTIDELPLRELLSPAEVMAALESGDEDRDMSINFDTALRWNVRDFYGDDILLVDDTSLPNRIKLRTKDVLEVLGMIGADVTTRDYRLTRQAESLAVFSPVMKAGKVSKGVRNEIESATEQGKHVHIYQDPLLDPQGLTRAEYDHEPGALGPLPRYSLIVFHDSSTDALQGSLRV